MSSILEAVDLVVGDSVSCRPLSLRARTQDAARDLIAEMRHLSYSSEQRCDVQRTEADLAAVTVDEKVLRSVIADAEDR